MYASKPRKMMVWTWASDHANVKPVWSSYFMQRVTTSRVPDKLFGHFGCWNKCEAPAS